MRRLLLISALCLAACSSQPTDPDAPAPRRAPYCDAFGCCDDSFGRDRCCLNSRDPFCDQRDPYWRERERQREDERRRSHERDRGLPLPPLPPAPRPGRLPRPF